MVDHYIFSTKIAISLYLDSIPKLLHILNVAFLSFYVWKTSVVVLALKGVLCVW